MLKKNHIATGVLTGMVFPATAVITAILLRNNFYLINKPALPYIVAIAINMILTRILFRKDFDNTAKGIMLGTFIFMVIILFIKVHPIR